MPVIVPNQRVEKWTVQRLLAQGGQGAVYEVVRDDIGQRGALKVLLAQRTSALVLQRFIFEAKAVNAIKHPNIPPVFDHGVFEDGTAWMVMGFVAGETLESRLGTRWLSLPEALSIAEDVAAALSAAHDKNIIHRDIKPSNIMLVAEEERATGERAMVLDFGIARLRDSQGVTSTGHLVGTPIYMAHEQGVRAKDVDGRADVYSLGVVLYQMLCRRVPFRVRREDGPLAILMAKAEPSTPIEQYAPTLAAELRALVNAMVAKERTQRPSMAEVRAVLRRLQGLQPTKQMGSHEALGWSAGGLSPASGALDYDEDDPADQDATDTGEAPLVQRPGVGPTPSEQRAQGEVSPHPPVAIPASLSDVATKPTRVPLLLAGPNEHTARPFPTQLVPPRLASPSISTLQGAPEGLPATAQATGVRQPRVGGWKSGVVLVVVLGMGMGMGIARWWLPIQPHPVGEAPPADLERPDAESATDGSPEAKTATDLAAQADLAPRVDLAHPLVRPKALCISRKVEANCVVTGLSDTQRAALLGALDEHKGVYLCPGERVSITGLPRQATLHGPPTWHKRQAAGPFQVALRGLDGSFPSLVEIQCAK